MAHELLITIYVYGWFTDKWHYNLSQNRFFTRAILLATILLTSSIVCDVHADRAARPLGLRPLYTPTAFGQKPSRRCMPGYVTRAAPPVCPRTTERRWPVI
jgi:hypothetical protein